MSDDDRTTDIVNGVCFQIGAQHLGKAGGAVGWWSPILGRLLPGQTVAVTGAWPHQRHLLANIVAGLPPADDAILRGPAALLDGIMEEALAIRANILRERIHRGSLGNEEWARLAVAAGEMDGAAFTLEADEGLHGVELKACARWHFGMEPAHADVQVDITDDDAGMHLHVIDGRQMPPGFRRFRLQAGPGLVTTRTRCHAIQTRQPR